MRGAVVIPVILLGGALASLATCSSHKTATPSGKGDTEATMLKPPLPDTAGAASAAPAAPPPANNHAKLHLSLRSTPPGATAAVDGKAVGNTPLLWDVDADGRAHQFDFMLPGYSTYKLRFPPTKDGVIHATMTPLPNGADGGDN